MQISDNMRGAFLMMGSMVAFTVNDAFLKAVSDELPLFQALFLRGIGTVVCLIILAHVLGQFRLSFGAKVWALIGLRSAAEVLAAIFFLTALFNMPLANVTAVLQALPLTVTLAGAVFLGEAIGWRRMLAILVGFSGVFLIVRPGAEGFNVYSLYALAAVGCVTLRDLVVRRMPRDVPSVMVGLVAAVAVMVFGGVACLTEDWAPVTTVAAAQLGGAMVAIVFGYVFSVAAMRGGDLGFVAPFRYAGLIAALILGWLVFAEWPDAVTLTGAAIVVATGLFTLLRERHTARRSTIGRLR